MSSVFRRGSKAQTAIGEAADDEVPSSDSLRDLYLELLEGAVMHTLYDPPDTRERPKHVQEAFVREFRRLGMTVPTATREEDRLEGRDRPVYAQTMVGLKRLRNVRRCVESVLADGVPGDLIEAGCWRGGVAITMRGILAAYGDRDRTVWAADSFQGLPAPDEEKYPADAGDLGHTEEELAVPLAEVRDNFRRYGLLDDRVRFLDGWSATRCLRFAIVGGPWSDWTAISMDRPWRDWSTSTQASQSAGT